MTKNSITDPKILKTSQFQKFVFVGGNNSNLNQDRAENNSLVLDSSNIWLNNAQINDWVAIAKINTDRSTRKYLHRLGLKLGITVKIISKNSNSVIIAIENRQIGLGAKITPQIIVTLLE